MWSLRSIPQARAWRRSSTRDVLIYVTSKLMHKKNQREQIGPVVRITTHDLLVATNRNTGGIIYERLEDALEPVGGDPHQDQRGNRG